MTTRKLEGKVIEGFGQWAVTTFGVECTEQSYFMDQADLAQRHHKHNDVNAFYSQVANKTWVNQEQFHAAYQFAIEHFNIDSGELKILSAFE
ncbi:hypothetical protein AB6D66_00630 [Vibrio pomeroyi]|uniref:Uncharacterized protein n=1 Tax=Vibrio pomeroyi TaxID=198832 RepID=A0ABV4MR35_9VIBR|nr:hypothetical protein [Vibrio atlanticus]MCZ4311055.1 hypothetical protein [Vibrio atlanticus]